MDKGFKIPAKAYFEQAHNYYLRWGATSKINKIKKKVDDNGRYITVSTTQSDSRSLDILSFVKSSQINVNNVKRKVYLSLLPEETTIGNKYLDIFIH